jgi:N-acetylglucosaminyldiphosphoundecaprenol N-acetyl-beta-D-mannosaminyltransferase
MLVPIAHRAARRGWKIYLVGGTAGVAMEAGRRLAAECGVEIAGVDASQIGVDRATDAGVLERIRAASPQLIFVALGAPKQERWIDEHAHELSPAVAMGVGASLDFVAGRVRRAPSWLSALGLEWAFRLVQEPRRLWRRYLVRDPVALAILLRAALRPRSQRVRLVPRNAS